MVLVPVGEDDETHKKEGRYLAEEDFGGPPPWAYSGQSRKEELWTLDEVQARILQTNYKISELTEERKELKALAQGLSEQAKFSVADAEMGSGRP